MSWILRQLDGDDFLPFAALFQPEQGVSLLLVNFIAVLELVKEGLLEVRQEAAYQEIYVRRAQAA